MIINKCFRSAGTGDDGVGIIKTPRVVRHGSGGRDITTVTPGIT